MANQDEELLDILGIARETSMRGAGISLRDGLSRSRYRERRKDFDEAVLLRLVRAYPHLVKEWFLYSEDKRTDGGWYLLTSGQIGRVGVRESKLHFASIEEAVAAYVIRELDFWAQLPDKS